MIVPTKLWIQLFHAALLLAWPPSVFAAVTIIDTLRGDGLAVFLVLLFISTLAGLTSVAVRVEQVVRETGKPLTYPWLFVGSNMLAAWLGGMAGFFFSENLDLGNWTELLIVLLFSFGGRWPVEYLLTNILQKYLPSSTVSGFPPTPAPPSPPSERV